MTSSSSIPIIKLSIESVVV